MRIAILGFIFLSFLPLAARAEELIPVPCWFSAPASIQASCFRFPVRENRADEAGKTLKLPVVVLHSRSFAAKNEDPVLYIPGGPGDGGWLDRDRIGFWWGFMEENPWARARDIVLYDPRGTGLTEPRMDCPELEDVASRILELGKEYDTANRLWRKASRECYERLIKEGFDPSQYTSAVNAQDLHELLAALGKTKWNIYGLSYGTRFALAYLRDFPKDIRSLILDSVLPPDVNFYEDTAWFVNRALETLAQGCAQSESCRAYGDLRGIYAKLVRRLNDQPLNVTVKHPYRDQDINVVFTGDMFIDFVFVNLYNRSDIETIPKRIKALESGNGYAVKQAAEDIVRTSIQRIDFGEAMSNSVSCIEERPFNDAAIARENFKKYPLLADLTYLVEIDQDCNHWITVAADWKETLPVSGAVPTLLLAGRYDPVTPPPYARKAAIGLEPAYLFEFSNVGHDVLSNEPCANRIAEKFLNEPWKDPADACFHRLEGPDFE